MLLSLIICNVPHPITLGEARQSSLLQVAKQWYVAWFQVRDTNGISRHNQWPGCRCPSCPSSPCWRTMSTPSIRCTRRIPGRTQRPWRRTNMHSGVYNEPQSQFLLINIFRDYTTWNRAINYYRCTMYNRHQELVRPSGRWMVKVCTLLILLPSITYY